MAKKTSVSKLHFLKNQLKEEIIDAFLICMKYDDFDRLDRVIEAYQKYKTGSLALKNIYR